ncbi:hypothetical protein ABIC09_000861 [Bradyrhizobium sp. S3.12.5]|uniref:hypothetical protein n=1 Tax=Bradyrhizobium sp. S3.12.5 TaxID=3156386 RepID=UPI00339A31FF
MRIFPLCWVRAFALSLLLLSVAVAIDEPVLAQTLSLGQSAPGPSAAALAAWKKFRQIIPEHFQDWIVAGDGPHFTLIYSEPPPAFSEGQYRSLFKTVFRGLTSVSLQSRPLGRNGQVYDFVLELDSSAAGVSGTSAIDEGVRTLSLAIYGTVSGARAIKLNELIDHPPQTKAPSSLPISGARLDNWLLGDNEAMEFLSPETGSKKTLLQLMSEDKSGRYISLDNSLVVLLADLTRPLSFADVTNVRVFALDSDLILGGVVEIGKSVAIVARVRQESWVDFPPLRVEDIVNLMVTKNEALAQSYDRTFPGAGRTSSEKGAAADWAPNYLSAELINTEFGSILNQADAILKSQSLSNIVSYEGYDIQPIKNPPYAEGVFSRLQAASLVFNFNTVGAGHWLIRKDGRRIFALNRAGSFSVTYLPSATGVSSTLAGSDAVVEAERVYTAWFNGAHSKTLTRSVQYMALYQSFQSTVLRGIVPYTDREKAFESIGDSLKRAIAKQFSACIEELGAKDLKFLDMIAAEYRTLVFQSGLGGLGTNPPSSKEEWVTRAARAAVAMRYDGNLSGATIESLGKTIEGLRLQYGNVLRAYNQDWQSYDPLRQAFDEYFKKYECELSYSPNRQGLKACRNTHGLTRDQAAKAGQRLSLYEIDHQSDATKFDRDKKPLEALKNKLDSEESALTATVGEAQRLQKKRIDAASPLYQDRLTVEVLTAQCGQNQPNFRQNILSEVESHAIEHLSPDAFFSVRTPTIVRSSNLSERFVGGHNVNRQPYIVDIDPGLSKGQFVSADGKLRISAGDSDFMSEIASSMSRAADADANTQARAFAAAFTTGQPAITDRGMALGVLPSTITSSDRAESTRVNLAASAGSAAHSVNGELSAIRIGRTGGGQLYFEETASGIAQQVAVYGAYGMPSIIEGRSRGKPSMTVVLDGSLSARDVDAVIANYKTAAPQTQAGGGGGGWRIPPAETSAPAASPQQPPNQPPLSKGGATTSGGGGTPRLVFFVDEATGRRRTIVETTDGRVELEVSKEVSREEILKLVTQEIESGASILLDATKTYVNGRGAVLLVTGFHIEQIKPILGDLAARARKREAPDGSIVERIRNAVTTAFARTKTKRSDRPAQIVDFLVEVKAGIKREAPEYEVSGRLDMTRGGLRFVLRLNKLSPEQAL